MWTVMSANINSPQFRWRTVKSSGTIWNYNINILNNRAGGVTVLWLVAWIFLVYESPREHSRITQEELNYIEVSLVGTGAVGREVSQLRVFSPNRDGQILIHISFPCDLFVQYTLTLQIECFPYR